MLDKTRLISTAVGSMPFDDPEYAVELSMSSLDVPAWPQLSHFGMNEQMEIQYAEGMPRVVFDRSIGRIYFDTSGDYSEDLAGFYEAYMAAMDPDDGNGDCSSMSISIDFSKGFYAMEKQLRENGIKIPILKVQTTGPCSFGLSIVDENKRAMWYNEEFRDVIIKALAMKSRWQIQKFQPFADKVICVVDEPILSAFGSSTYVSVKRDDVVDALKEVIDAIHSDNGIAGVHCCGNTEWSIPIDAGVEILNFDAFGFGETIAMYADSVKGYLGRGGILAWGIVPASSAIREQTVDGLESYLERLIDNLAEKGIDRQTILEQSMITPSCGTGSMIPADAEEVFKMTQNLTRQMKGKYGFYVEKSPPLKKGG